MEAQTSRRNHTGWTGEDQALLHVQDATAEPDKGEGPEGGILRAFTSMAVR